MVANEQEEIESRYALTRRCIQNQSKATQKAVNFNAPGPSIIRHHQIFSATSRRIRMRTTRQRSDTIQMKQARDLMRASNCSAFVISTMTGFIVVLIHS